MAVKKSEWGYAERATTLIEALLSLANDKPESRPDSEVLVEWDSPTTLLVTGTRKGEDGKLHEGTTLRDLLKLIEKYETLPVKYASKDKADGELASIVHDVVRNGIKTLEKSKLLEYLRPRSQKTKELKKSNSPYWIFKLTLKGKNLSTEENLKYVKEKLGISAP